MPERLLTPRSLNHQNRWDGGWVEGFHWKLKILRFLWVSNHLWLTVERVGRSWYMKASNHSFTPDSPEQGRGDGKVSDLRCAASSRRRRRRSRRRRRNQPSSVPERETSGLPTSCHLRQASPTFDRNLGNPRNTLLEHMNRCQMAALLFKQLLN